MKRRNVLQLGLGGIAALGAVPRIGAQKAMAADGHDTFVYISNAGTKDISVFGMNRDTGELTVVVGKRTWARHVRMPRPRRHR